MLLLCLCCVITSVAYLGFHFGGRVKIFLENWGYLHGAKPHAARGKATRLLGGFRSMLPEKKIKNGAIWCVLESILLKFCQKIILKIVIFYIKITDNVLLRTIFRGIAAYTPQISCHLCDLVCFGVQFP